MFGLPRSGAALGRVALHSADPDRLRVRQRLDRALANVEWTPPGLPPRSILLLRRLAAPVPPHGVASSFALRVSAEVARSAARARRPHLDADAAAAEAVIFADEAELVACLVRDWLRGRVAEHWWWRGLLARATAEEWLRQHVLPRGEVLAPALSLLATRTEVVPWIARQPAADVRMAASAVARAFALAPAAPSLRLAHSAGRDDDGDTAAPRAEGGVVDRSAAVAVARVIATVPALRAPELGREQRRLLALVCVAVRAPAWGRTAQFAAAMAALDRVEAEGEHAVSILLTGAIPARPAEVPTTGDAPEARPAARPMDTPLPAGPSAGDTASVTAPISTPVRRPWLETRDPGAAPPNVAPPAGQQPHTSASAPVGHARTGATSDERAGEDTPVIPAGPDVPPVESEWRLPVPQIVVDGEPKPHTRRTETDFGGIFYLLNAWIAMGLYGDFTAPRAANLAISPWDLLALVGRAWFGNAFVEDAVWQALADLAVREADAEPGHDAGMPAGWLEQHLDKLDARLRAALGVEPHAAIAEMVCRYHATIDVTASAVHVHLALCDLPLDLRVAGLDRDPGWIPAAGRAVFFHFA